MNRLRRTLVVLAVTVGVSVGVAGTALANPNPNGSGRPASGGGDGSITCQNIAAANPNLTVTPGHSANAPGSPFNPSGKAGGVYSPISEYDIACFQHAAHAN